MRLGCLALAGVAACYSPPTAPPCSITCTTGAADACPGDLECVAGLCTAAGETCTPTFTAVSAGADFACALDTNKARWCWGNNDHHQIDFSRNPQYSAPMRAQSEPPWDLIELGRDHTCAISGGHLWCWGGNEHSQVTGAIVGDVRDMVEITKAGVTAWTAVSAGVDVTCAIGDGHLYCWGRDDAGQLGNNQVTPQIGTPVEVSGGITDWTAVAASEFHTCGVSTSAGVQCWGRNISGELGPNGGSGSPVPVGVLSDAGGLVATAQAASCATRTDGMVWCWGQNTYFELGTMTPGDVSSPTPVLSSTETGWTQLGGGALGFCGLAGSDARCWGTASIGGLASGVWSERNTQLVESGAAGVAIGPGVRAIANAETWDLDLGCDLVGGAVHCWGDNRRGQLGQGAATMALAPAPVVGAHAFAALAAGRDHVCGIEGSTLLCWGSTEQGQATGVAAGAFGSDASLPRTPCVPGADCDLGTPKAIGFEANATHVATGAEHTCALAGSVVTCWGAGELGQLGGGTTAAPAPRPVTWTGAPFTTLLAAAPGGQCAAGSDGALACWGELADHHPSSVPVSRPMLAGVTTYGVDGHFGCFLGAGSALVCYGDDTEGEFGDGSGSADDGAGTLHPIGRIYRDLAVSSGTAACGVRPDGIVECWGHDDYGQTGDPANVSMNGRTLIARPVDGLSACTAVAMGHFHTCALCGGAVSCWGDDSVGQWGTGTLDLMPSTTPHVALPAAPSDPWIALVAGDTYTCARSQLGAVSCWGFDEHGALGTGGVSACLPVPIHTN